MKRLFTIFYSMLYISAFTFGGGFVIVSLMKKRFSDELGWVDEKETLDMIALAQSAPGPIAVNAAILFGWRMAGLGGMISAVIGTIIPPLVIISAIYFIYDAFRQNAYVARFMRGMQAGVAAVLFSVVVGLAANLFRKKNALGGLIALAALAASLFVPGSAMYVVIGAAALGAAKAVWLVRKERRA